MARQWLGCSLGMTSLGLALGCPAPGQDPPEPSTSTLPGTAPDGTSTDAGNTGSTSTDPTGADSGSSSMGQATVSPPYFDVGGVADMGAGSRVCSGDLKQVLDSGTGVVIENCSADQGCLDGQCVPACLAASGAEGSLGCEFIIPTSPFYANGNPGASQSGPCHALLVSNPWDRSAVLELSRDGMSYDVPAVTRIPDGIAAATNYDPLPISGVPSGQVAVVFLSHRPGVNNGSTLECPVSPAVLADTAAHGTTEGLAFSLLSDTPVQVYDIIPYGGAPTFLPSASLLYPSAAWGDGYLLTSPHPPDGTEWLLAVAREDDTTLSIQPTVSMVPGTIANPPMAAVTQYTFDAGEVLQWQANGDPVGTILSADKPIGVFSGNTYLRVDTADGPLSGRDSNHQMIPDVNALASEYVGPGLFSRLAGFAPESVLYRLVGVVDGTVLSWDAAPPPGAPAMIGEGEVFEFETREVFSVASQDEDHPFSLSQYMSGTLSGQPGCTGQAGPCQLGDDEWVVLVPPAQFLRSYAFFVDPTYGTSTLVFVREAGPTGFHDVDLACMGTITGWQPVGNAGVYEYAHVELFRSGSGAIPACETSQHLAQSDGHFGVLVWGTDSAASYGYPAGGNLQSINQVDVDPAG
ncbi:MAG: IgGFc-binding protein [Myxococcales bacterium]|nr:IgGFc-binding protein [Myxococcales bacterium]